MNQVAEELLNNKVLWISILSWAIAQGIKMAIDLIRNKKFDIVLLLSSGGMPSSHSSFVMALATSVGLIEGFDSLVFAICAITSMVVMYDAAGVRRAAGRQAVVLNILIETFEKQNLQIDERLKEILGHSPVEVAAGAILGIVVAVLTN